MSINSIDDLSVNVNTKMFYTDTVLMFSYIIMLFLMMLCYGKYNSFRVAKIGMQEITELFRYVFRIFTHKIIPLQII